MTANAALKRSARQRAASTGEKYTVARRTVLDSADEQPVDVVEAEFDRQLENLIAKDYPRLAGISREKFRALIEPLRGRLDGLSAPDPSDVDESGFVRHVPFVIVISRELIRSSASIEQVERQGNPGFSVLEPDDLARFEPLESLELPAASAYLLVDIEPGRRLQNSSPDDCLAAITASERTPLTTEEGIALVTHHPEAVANNAGFYLLGSRCGDRRVTALWISKKQPKLGWCWARHTWLGAASAGGRR